MLTIRPIKTFSHALGAYLRQADYYSEGMQVEGRCFGRLCERVGLTERAEISDEAFARVATNRHALTGKKLTVRQKSGRRAGYDAVFSAPKSVSIQAFLGGDARLIAAHDRAVAEALGELEVHAARQAGQGINKRYATTGEIAGAVFRHGESRALDPQLHSHAFIFNVTQGDAKSGRLLALESSNIFERATYLTEVYRNALARDVQRLGYKIERRANGFELAGVPAALLERFSKRAKQRDAAIAAREAELGRELTRDEVSGLVRKNRAKKQYEGTPEKVRADQLAQINESELAQLQALRAHPQARWQRTVTPAEAVQRAVEHVFERRTVVPAHEFTAEVIRQCYGQYSLRDLQETVRHSQGRLIVARGQVTTPVALELERSLIDRINAGLGRCAPLGRETTATGLAGEQAGAVKTILGSRDRVLAFCGKAGTGKTHTLATAVEGMAAAGQKIACFAPSTQAVAILRDDGSAQLRAGQIASGRALSDAGTVQRLLIDPAQQAAVRGAVLVIDEYSLLSTRQLDQVLALAENQNCRVLLVGDSGQHRSVEAGDAARIVEKESRISLVTIRDIKRQSTNPAYRAAAQALAEGSIADGLRRLDRMGAVVEIENPTGRRVQMVAEWFAAAQETKTMRTQDGTQTRAKTALMVAPTWAEIDALNAHARARLRAAGQLRGDDRPFTALHAKDWTKAQQKDFRNYRPGNVLVAHKATKHFQKYDELRVVRREKRRLIVARGSEEFSVSPRQSALAWTVCEERAMPLAQGDRVRLRAVARVQTASGQTSRLANGATVVIKATDPTGRLVLADGSTLLSRQVVHGYAMTSHAAQGLTVDKVFVAGATSREGLYVSATRGREGIRIFIPDRKQFLSAAGLRSEARVSATEFVRTLGQRESSSWLHRWQTLTGRAYQRLTQLRKLAIARLSPQLAATVEITTGEKEAVAARPEKFLGLRIAEAPPLRRRPVQPTPMTWSHDDAPSPSPHQGMRLRM